jgi:hypothetical protein
MHPPRRNGALEHPKLADRFADWLLSHCPVSSLTLLTLLVTSPLGVPLPSWEVIAAVLVVDGVINLVRLRRRPKPAQRVRHGHHPTPMHPGATV